jgi:hypothetical protein
MLDTQFILFHGSGIVMRGNRIGECVTLVVTEEYVMITRIATCLCHRAAY